MLTNVWRSNRTIDLIFKKNSSWKASRPNSKELARAPNSKERRFLIPSQTICLWGQGLYFCLWPLPATMGFMHTPIFISVCLWLLAGGEQPVSDRLENRKQMGNKYSCRAGGKASDRTRRPRNKQGGAWAFFHPWLWERRPKQQEVNWAQFQILPSFYSRVVFPFEKSLCAFLKRDD